MPTIELTPKAQEFANQPAPERLRWSLEQLDEQDGMAVVLGMHFVMRPDILGKSECPHRTVAATVFSQIPETVSPKQAQSKLGKNQVDGAVVKINGRNYLYVVDVNRWTDRVEPKLDCKDEGIPWEMGLTALNSRQEVTQRSQVDLLCPKRQQDKVCHIEHAEPLALRGFTRMAEELGIEELENCFIICNWVNCPSCLDLLKDHADLFKNSRVISLFAALDDQEDLKSITETKRLFEEERLGELHGPYMWVEKGEGNEGYGWMPVETKLMEQYFISKIRPIYRISPEDQNLINISRIAFELVLGRDIKYPPSKFNLYN